MSTNFHKLHEFYLLFIQICVIRWKRKYGVRFEWIYCSYATEDTKCALRTTKISGFHFLCRPKADLWSLWQNMIKGEIHSGIPITPTAR